MENTFDLMAQEGNPRNSEGSFVQLKNGNILFVYTRYDGQSYHDHAAASLHGYLSADGGLFWRDAGKIMDRGDADNIMSVSLLRLRNGRILLSFLEKRRTATAHPECVPLRCFSDDECETWSKPEPVTPRHEYFVVNNDRVVQLTSGRILMPRSLHRTGENGSFLPATAGVFYSDDQGATWSETPDEILPPEGMASGFQEPGVIELEPGRIMLWARNDSGHQYKTFSKDGGVHWEKAVPAPEFPSPCAPLSMKRRPDGALIAVWNNHPYKDEWFKRTPLVMAESYDNGQNWIVSKEIGSDPERGYCYTAILFADDAILLGYCFGKNVDGHCCLQDLRLQRLELPKWTYPVPPEAK